MQPISIYIHFPFCIKKCNYCDFISFPVGCDNSFFDDNLFKLYLSEISLYKDILSNRIISTIYFGGGTPSLIPSIYIEKILLYIYKNFKIIDNPEITLEVNPKTVDRQKLQAFYTAGINRLSIGIQSFDDKELQFLGRIHNSHDAFITLEYAGLYFNNISCDFIYALPDQSFLNWQKSLNQIKNLPVSHLSLYQLIIEPKTPLYNQVKTGKIKPIDDDLAIKMFEYTNKFLKYTFPQYEISNYAKKGFESKHNLNYWNGGDYIGIGVGAAGRIKFNSKFYTTTNHPTITKWREQILTNKIPLKYLSKKSRAKELIILGLRKNKGINFNEFILNSSINFWDIVNKDSILNFIRLKLLILTKNNIKVSVKGQNVLNAIIRDIIL